MLKKLFLLVLTTVLTFGLFTTTTSAKDLTGTGIGFKLLSIVIMDDNKITDAGIGLVVDSLVAGSPAEKAGVMVGDELVSIYQYSIVSANGNRVEILSLELDSLALEESFNRGNRRGP